jgi:outer membrane receptor for ferrienterochelin and colicin
VNSYEVGYRAQLFKKLYIDADYFYNTYNNFIATQNIIGKVDGSRLSATQIGAAAPTRFQNLALPTRVIQIAANVDQRVQSQGAGLTLTYAFDPALTVSGNYSYNDLITKEFKAGTQSFFNTPKSKFNLGLDGQLLDPHPELQRELPLGRQLRVRVHLRHRHRAHGPNRGRAAWLHHQKPAHHAASRRHQPLRHGQPASVRRA